MSARYTHLFLLPDKLYTAGSPIVIAAGALLIDNHTQKVLAQLKLKNIVGKPIKAVTINVFPKDTAGRTLGEPVVHQYLDLHAQRDAEFCQKVPVPIPNSSTRSFDVAVTEVIFSDNSIWNGSDKKWEILPPPRQFPFDDAELLKQYRLEYGLDCKYEAEQVSDLWYCACGALNHQDELSCHVCSKSYEVISSIDKDALTANRNARLEEEAEQARLAKEKAEKEAAARLEQEKKAKEEAERIATEAAVKRKKKLKIAAVITSAATVCIAFVVILITVIIPNIKYNSASALIDEGKYKEAILAFEELNEYKDSAEKIDACRAYIGLSYNTLDDGTIEITAINVAVKSLIIPSQIDNRDVTGIAKLAFNEKSGITSVTIPDTVNTVGNKTFFKCSGLEEIDLGKSITSISDSMFTSCVKLSSITIPDSVKSIGEYSFSNCSNLTSVTIPDSVTTIGRGAFSHCTTLKDITIPESVTNIGNWAFNGVSITIHGKKGSAAEKYAKAKHLTFKEE